MAIALSGFVKEASAQNEPDRMTLGVRLSTTQATVNNAVSFRYSFNEKTSGEALLGFNPWSVGFLYERFFPMKVEGLYWFAGGGSDER